MLWDISLVWLTWRKNLIDKIKICLVNAVGTFSATVTQSASSQDCNITVCFVSGVPGSVVSATEITRILYGTDGSGLRTRWTAQIRWRAVLQQKRRKAIGSNSRPRQRGRDMCVIFRVMLSCSLAHRDFTFFLCLLVVVSLSGCLLFFGWPH